MKSNSFNSLFISISFLYLIKFVTSEEKIIFSFQMNRHGARAPYYDVKNGTDIYKEPWDFVEELTSMGKRQLYLLGAKVRKRYKNFLSEKYDPNEILIKSTDYNRTIESINSYLQGLYPSGTAMNISSKVKYVKDITYPPNKKYKKEFDEIINKYNINETGEALPNNIAIAPIHIMNKKDQTFDLFDENLCSYRNEINDIYQNMKLVRDFADKAVRETGNLFFELEPTDNRTFLYDYWTMYKYMDGFYCDDFDQRKFDYIKNTYGGDMINKLKDLSDEFLMSFYFDVTFNLSDPEVGLASSSDTMRKILEWMKDAKNKSVTNSQYLKFVIYSAHDSSVGSLDSFMRTVFNTSMYLCDFACSRLLELYKDEDKYYVRYITGNETNILNIDYETFNEKVSENAWSDKTIKGYCKNGNKNEDEEKSDEGDKKEKDGKEKNNTLLYVMIALIIFNVIMIVLFILIRRKILFGK